METFREGRFPKSERLHSNKAIVQLFAEGDVLFHYPFKVYFSINQTPLPNTSLCAFAVVVPKRNFKRAVHRNLIKRRIREAYRKNKAIIHEVLQARGTSLIFLLRYVSSEQIAYPAIEQAMQTTLAKLSEAPAFNTDIPPVAAD